MVHEKCKHKVKKSHERGEMSEMTVWPLFSCQPPLSQGLEIDVTFFIAMDGRTGRYHLFSAGLAAPACHTCLFPCSSQGILGLALVSIDTLQGAYN